MSETQTVPAYRTMTTAIVFGLFVLIALFLVRGLPSDVAVSLFGNACTTFAILLAAVAGKSSVEHLAVGGGIGGAARALLTSAKPGDPPPDAKAAPEVKP